MKVGKAVGAMSSTTIIIPQYSRCDLTLNCIASLRKWLPAGCEILVVDDGSPDDSADRVAESGVRVIEQQHQGITSAWNRGIEQSDTETVILLNNDVVCHGEWITPLIKPLMTVQASLVGVGWRIETSLRREVLDRLGGARFLTGWCFGFQRIFWKQVGGFDESLHLYFSDTDFQGRASQLSESAGLQVVSGLPLEHLEHQTAHARQLIPQRRSLWLRDRQRMLEKWSPAEAATKSDQPLPGV